MRVATQADRERPRVGVAGVRAEHAHELLERVVGRRAAPTWASLVSPWVFSTRKCRSAAAAICGRCVMQSTCAVAASSRSLSVSTRAVRPPMPASTSSKTSISVASPSRAASRTASAMRDSSPPEATLPSGPAGQPGVGGQAHLHGVAPARAERRLGDRDLEARAVHAHVGEVALDAPGERLGGLLAPLVQGRREALRRRPRPPRPRPPRARCARRRARPRPARARPPRRAAAGRRPRPPPKRRRSSASCSRRSSMRSSTAGSASRPVR